MREYPLVGDSGGAAAVVAVYATVLSELDLDVNLFFVIPLRIRVKYIGLAVLAAGAVCWATMTAPTIGPVAIVARSVVGWLYVRQLGFGSSLVLQRYFHERRKRAARRERMR